MKILKIIAISLLCAISATALAENKTIGSWTFSPFQDGTGSTAATNSDSGGVFGIACFSGSGCAYFFNPQLGCEEGATVPLLLSSESGAMAIQGKCIALDKTTKVLALTGDMDTVVAGAGTIGIAIAMKNGKFTVLRFNMNGAIQTITMAKESIKGQHAAPSDNPNKDTVL